jgi:hypothetical protein
VIDAYAYGREQLATLERNRARILAVRRRRLAALADLVAREIERDVATAKGERGRCARIAKRLRHVAPARTVYRVFASRSEWQESHGLVAPTIHGAIEP